MEAESFEDEEIAAPAQPTIRAHQGRPRGATRRRRDLHDRRAAPHRRRRLADERVAHRPIASPSSAAPTSRRATEPAALRRGFLDAPRRARTALGAGPRPGWSRPTGSLTEAVRTALASPARGRRRASPGAEPIVGAVEPPAPRPSTTGTAGCGAPPSSPPACRCACCCATTGAPATRARCSMATLTLRADGGRRHPRPGGRRLPPLLHGRRAGWCPTSRRCSTTTPCWRWPTPRPGRRPAGADLARVVAETLDYLLREMTSPEGGLCSATDADSEGEEGRFFTWSRRRAPSSCWGRRRRAFMAFHGVTRGRQLRGPERPLGAAARTRTRWEALARPGRSCSRPAQRRVPPLRDEKVLAGWNGLAISALAVGGRVLAEPRYVGGGGARRPSSCSTRMVKDGRLQRQLDGRARRACRPSSRTTPSWSRGCSICSRPPSSRAGWPPR